MEKVEYGSDALVERSVNISITRITRVNNCYIAISDDISTHADFQVDGYHGC